MDLADARGSAQRRSAPRARASSPAAEATHGFLPGPEHDPAVAAGLDPAERSTYVIATSYHTAVVGAILAAALLRTPGRRHRRPDNPRGRHPRGPPPPPPPPGPPLPGRPPRRPARTRCPSSGSPTARGSTRCVPLPPTRRAACTPLLLGAELRTAAARRDPARVHHVVAWAAEHGWAHLPSVRQGAALLTRVVRAAAEPATVAC